MKPSYPPDLEPTIPVAARTELDPVLILDATGTIVHALGPTLDVLGYAECELVGRELRSLAPTRPGQPSGPGQWSGAAGSSQLSELSELRRADGSPVSVRLMLRPFDLEGNRYTLCSVRDRCGEEGGEDSAGKMHGRYRDLFQASPDPAYISARDGRILAGNPALWAFLGYEPGRPEGPEKVDIRDFYADPADRERFQAAIELDGKVTDVEVDLRRADGSLRRCAVTATLRRDSRGEVLGYQGIIKDVTEARQLEQRFLQSRKMEAVGRLAGGIAHDFNNLLTTIMMNLELVLDDGELPLHAMEGLSEIGSAAERAAALTGKLLAHARRQVLRPRPTDLGELLQGVGALLERIVGDDVELQVEVEPALPPVSVDPGRLEQVVMNLAVNARDAMPRGGTLRLSAREVVHRHEVDTVSGPADPGRYVQLSVEDTGVGISPEVGARVFDPFFTTKEEGQGSGLGLSTVYGIVAQSGGHIHLHSAPARGTSVGVCLPVFSPRPEPDERSGAAPAS